MRPSMRPRSGEILTLSWEHVDFARACLPLPDSKTGSNVIHLNAPVLSVLTGMERHEGNPYAIVSAEHCAHLVNLQKPWRAIGEKSVVAEAVEAMAQDVDEEAADKLARRQGHGAESGAFGYAASTA